MGLHNLIQPICLHFNMTVKKIFCPAYFAYDNEIYHMMTRLGMIKSHILKSIIY